LSDYPVGFMTLAPLNFQVVNGNELPLRVRWQLNQRD
jgi:hypothetical protein